jgi:hypothetical protein
MAGGWIDNGPVSLPPRILAYGAGAVVLGLAIAGAGLGFDAAWRRQGGQEPSVSQPANRAGDLVAKPIVEIAPPTPAPEADKEDDDDKANDQAKAEALAAQTAAAQSLQAKPAAKGDIDDILTSPTEKPPPAIKAPIDEAPPTNAPVKTDVPF